MPIRVLALAAAFTLFDSLVVCGAEPSAERGWQLLRTKTYLPPDFDQQVFDNLWQAWPSPERELAAAATPAERRRLTFSRYGLIEAPNNNDQGRALGYVDDGKNGWVMNCLACHGGKVAGKVIPGLGNSHTALHSLTEDVRITKLKQLKRPGHLDLASLKMPLGTTHGTTNSVIFGIALGNLRLPDMQVDRSRPEPKLDHHDMDAPPFWNVKKKRSLYADGFAPKNARVLMQFLLLPSHGPEQLNAWESDFADILAWIESVEAPKYPFAIDQPLATQGKRVFETHCSSCHGTYSEKPTYEQQTIPIDVVKTDRIRLEALTREHRQWMKAGWMSRYGKDPVEVDTMGYVAPPLDGIWASAPYFHNGSVPTLWHVLHPAERLSIWKRTEDGYDQQRVGLEVETFQELPKTSSAYARRQYFDTRIRGKTAGGHDFPNKLTDIEKQQVLEYLKTL